MINILIIILVMLVYLTQRRQRNIIIKGGKLEDEYPYHIIKDVKKINTNLHMNEYSIYLDDIQANKFIFILYLDFLKEVMAKGSNTNITKDVVFKGLDIFFKVLKPISSIKKYCKDIINKYLDKNTDIKKYFISDIILELFKTDTEYYNYSLEDQFNYEKFVNKLKKFNLKNICFDTNLLNHTTYLGDNTRKNSEPFNNMIKFLEKGNMRPIITNTHICDGLRMESIKTNNVINKVDDKVRNYKIYINKILLLEIICSVHSLIDPKTKIPLITSGVSILKSKFYPFYSGPKLKEAIEDYTDNNSLVIIYFRKTCKDIIFSMDASINNNLIISKDALPTDLTSVFNMPSLLVNDNRVKESGNHYYIKRLLIPKRKKIEIYSKTYNTSEYIKGKVFLIRRRINQGEAISQKWYDLIGNKYATYEIIDFVISKFNELVTKKDIPEISKILMKYDFSKDKADKISTELVNKYMIDYQVI